MTDGGWHRDPAVALLTISRIVGGATDLTEALRQTCRELARFTGAETVSAHLLHTDRRMLVPSAAYDLPPEMMPSLLAATPPVAEQRSPHSRFSSSDVASSRDGQTDAQFGYRL